MRYERKVKVIVEDVPTTVDLVIDYEVASSIHRLVVRVTRTRQRLPLGELADAEWWWNLCPHRIASRMDAEMMQKWQDEQAVVDDASLALDALLGVR